MATIQHLAVAEQPQLAKHVALGSAVDSTVVEQLAQLDVECTAASLRVAGFSVLEQAAVLSTQVQRAVPRRFYVRGYALQ